MNQIDREKKKVWRDGEQANARASFPLSDERMASLFGFVEKSVDEHGCDHSRCFTEKWLTDNAYPLESVINWLESKGGYCDCEVIFNAQDHWNQNR